MDEFDSKDDDYLLDIEDLIEAASSNSETFSDEAARLDPAQLEVREFIRNFNIKPSKTYLPLDLIYFTYSNQTVTPVSKHKLSMILKQYFTRKTIMGLTCFRLDPTSFGLPSYYSLYRDPAYHKNKRKFDCAYEGVYKASGFFLSRIKLEDGTHYLGQFKTAREAAMEYDRHALYHFGSTTKLNFPERIKDYEKEIKEKP